MKEETDTEEKVKTKLNVVHKFDISLFDILHLHPEDLLLRLALENITYTRSRSFTWLSLTYSVEVPLFCSRPSYRTESSDLIQFLICEDLVSFLSFLLGRHSSPVLYQLQILI